MTTSQLDAPTRTDVAELRIGERLLELPVEQAVEGQAAVNVASLLKDGHVTTLDYGYANTASTRSAITFLDGDAGILRYRGYPIEQLAERSTFLETAYLLIYGELPTPEQLATWTTNVRRHTLLMEQVAHRVGVIGGPRIVHGHRKMEQVPGMNRRVGLVNADAGKYGFIPGPGNARPSPG